MSRSRGEQQKAKPAPSRSDDSQAELDLEVAAQQRKCTEILKQARRDANQAISVGEDTSIQLAKQGEQMSNIDKKLDETEYELKVSDRLVKSIGSWGGAIVSWMLPKPKAPKTPANNEQPAQRAPEAVSSSSAASATASRGQTGATDRKRASSQQQEKEVPKSSFGLTKEEDDLLDGLGQDISILKHHAHVHRTVLEEQNRQLDQLNAKADKVQDHLHKTNRNVKQLL